MLRLGLVLLLSAALGALACRRADPPAEAPGAPSVALAASQSGADPAPDQLRAFPVPPGFRPVGGVAVQEADGERRASAVWQGRATGKEVAGFYQKTAAQQGWTEQFAASAGAGGQVRYETLDPGVSVLISYRPVGEQVELTVVLVQAER